MTELPLRDPAAKPGSENFSAPVPPWLQLPVWLHESWRGSSVADALNPRLLDLLWAQYALFLYIRIQDDLLDGHLDDLQLQFVADHFLVDSLESLDRARVTDAKSRAFYRGCLQSTVGGILRVRRLEAVPGNFDEHHLPLHAEVSGIFKVAAAAVCTLYRRSTNMAWLVPLQDELAISGQICDDVQDLADDVRAGRYTFAANALIGSRAGETMTPIEAMHRVTEGMLIPSRTDRIVVALGRSASRARAVVPNYAPEPIHALVDSLEERGTALNQILHEARVGWIFGENLPRAGPRIVDVA